jgi:hypothetical protein
MCCQSMRYTRMYSWLHLDVEAIINHNLQTYNYDAYFHSMPTCARANERRGSSIIIVRPGPGIRIYTTSTSNPGLVNGMTTPSTRCLKRPAEQDVTERTSAAPRHKTYLITRADTAGNTGRESVTDTIAYILPYKKQLVGNVYDV